MTDANLEELVAVLESKLEDEPAALEVLAQAVVRGESSPELFQLLHEAAKRDDRMADLALAYDALTRDKKFRMLPPAAQVELLLHAADFSADYFGELEGAQAFLERVLSMSPSHPEAFAKLERVFQERQDGLRLSELYVTAASQRSEKADQLVLLRAAVGLLAGYPEEEERALKLHHQILKLDQADPEARKAIGARLLEGGRVGDFAKLLEHALLAENTPPEEEMLDIRAQLITIYTQKTNEVERALPHAEEVLKTYPHNERARSVVEQLLGHKVLCARAAAALEGVYSRLGNHDEAARMLTIQIDSQRGPRRLEAQKRLAGLLYQRRGDLPGSFALYEGIITVDPGDDEVRSRYRTIGTALDRRLDVTRVLTRASSAARDPVVRAKIGADLGELLLEGGDTRRARASFQAVLDSGADDDASLRAARALVDLNTEANDLQGLAAVLDKLSDIEPEVDERAAAAERLAQLYMNELGDQAGAIGAFRKMLDTPLEGEALPVLESLYTEANAHDELAFVLERRAAIETEPEAAREIAFRAADLRSSQTTDRTAALEGWQRFVAAHGPSREAHERLLPLLEQEKRWEELAATLAADASLAPTEEQAAIYTRLAQLRLQRLNDGAGALDAYRQALDADPSDRICRLAVEKMLHSGDHRLAAAAVLEPLYRSEESAEGLARVLDVRAALEPEFSTRLEMLREAADIVENKLGDPKRTINLAGQGLREAVEAGLEDLSEWFSIIDRLAPPGTYAVRRAEVLGQALGDREINGPALMELARRTGEARAESGDMQEALAIYRRALAFEADSPELLSRVDALLAEQGTAEERLAMYRDALEAANEPARRQELLHSIGSIERRANDLNAAVATYRKALDEDPSDSVAYEALLEIHTARGAWEPLYEELGRGLARAEGKERAAIALRMAQVAVSAGKHDRAAAHYRDLLTEGAALDDSVLDAIEELARKRSDVELRRMVLERRVSTAADPLSECRCVEQLGALQAEEIGDARAAIGSFLRAAELAESAREPERSRELYERVRGLDRDERTSTRRLVQIYEQSEEWEKLPDVYGALMRTSESRGEASDWLIAFEPAAVKARATQPFVAAADGLIEPQDGDALSAEQRDAVILARARVIGADPDRRDEAAATYRRMIEEPDAPSGALAEFELFVIANPDRHEDRRWLFGYRLRHAQDNERVGVLLDWASAEESALSDATAAAKLYQDVLAIDPNNDTALRARGRLLLDLGDVEGAAALIAKRRELHQGPERVAIDLELATVQLERLGRYEEALATVTPVIEATPGDPNALRLLESALARPETKQRAAELLESACDSVEDPQIAANILKVLLSMPADTPELKQARLGWFERLLERPDASPELALEIALQAVQELPAELSLWDRAEAMASTLEKAEPVAAAYRARLDAEADPNTPSRLDPDTLDEISRRAVDYYEEWFDEPETVLELLSCIVDVCPNAAWAFERLKLVYNEEERWGALFTLYDRIIARTSDDKDSLIDLLEDAAQSAKDLANDADRAVGYLEQLLPLKQDAYIRSSLERLYERLARHRPLIDLLGMELHELSGEDAQRMRARIAALWLDGVGDADATFGVIEAMLADDSAQPDAFDLLERILTHTAAAPDAAAGEGAPAAPAPAARQQAARLLETRYRTENQPTDLVRILDVELEAADEPSARAALLREIVQLRADVLNDPEGALESLAALVALEPSDKHHREQLEQIAERVGRFDRLADVLVSVGERCKQKLKIELFSRALAIYRDKLQDRSRAIDLGRAILALNPKDNAVLLRTARELDALLAEENRSAERCDVLERVASVEKDLDARREALLTVARLASRDLGDRPRAIAAYRTRLSDEAKDLEALSGLIDELAAEQQFAELAAALEDRAAQTDGEDARRDCVRVAELFDRELADTARAITVWEGVRTRFGADDSSCDALAVLLEKAERWTDLAVLLEQSAGAAESEPRRAELWRRLGDIQRDRTMEWAKAVQSYEAALDATPAAQSDAGAARVPLEGIENLLSQIDPSAADHRPILSAAVGVLQRAYSQTDDWQRTIGLLESRLAAAESDDARIEILGQTAVLLEEREQDPSAAFDAVWRAFSLIPNPTVAQEVLRLASVADRWGHVAEAFSSIEARGDVPAPVARELWWNVALWHRDRRGDAGAAEAALEKALGYEPESAQMLSALVEIRRQSPGRPLITSLLALADATGANLALYREAAETAMGPVADSSLAKGIAEKLLETAIARWSSDEDAQSEPARAASWAIGVLAGIYRGDGEIGRVIELCLRGARLPFDKAERRALRMSAAEIAEPSPAISIYEELFEEDPTDSVVGERLEVLYRDENRRADLLSLRGRQIDVCEDVGTRVSLRLDLALLLVKEDAVDRAIKTLRQGLSEIPTHAASVEKLAELLDAGGDHAALAALWEEQAALHEAQGDESTAAELWRRAANIAENRVNDVPRAIADHRKAARFFDMESLDALARLYTARSEHAAAAKVLETICARTPNDASPHPALRLAEALVDSGEPAEARERLEQAIGVVTDAAPLRARLSSLYREAELWGPLADLTALEASLSSDPAIRTSLLCEAAQLHLDKRSDPQAAVPLLEQAATLSPDDRAIRLSLCDALSSAGRPEEAMATLRDIIAGYGNRRPKERAIVHYHLARVAISINDRAQALTELELALKIDPAHPDILYTLAKLGFEEGQLDRAQRTYRALLLVLRRQRDDQASVTATRSEVLLALSEIAQRQDDPDRASEHVESAFEAAAESPEECNRLIVALRARAHNDSLARALELRLASPGTDGEMAEHLTELAGIYEQHLDRPADAFEARLRAFSLAPTPARHNAALDLARRTGDVPRYAEALTRLVDESSESERLVDLLLALGRMLESDLGDLKAAVHAYRRAERVLQSLSRSITDDDGTGPSELTPRLKARVQDVWRALEAAYGQIGDTEAQAKILEERVAQAATFGLTAADQADALYRIASLRFAAADACDAGTDALEKALATSTDPGRAEGIFRKALEVSPRNERLLKLFEQFARDGGATRCLIDALVGLSVLDGNIDRLKEAFDHAQPLGDSALAESILRRVLERSEGQGEGAVDLPQTGWALIALSELREAAGDPAEAVSLKERAARIAEPDQERSLLLSAAALAQGLLGDLPRAAAIYEKLREREPADRKLWEPLAQLYRQLGDAGRLAALIDQTVPLVEDIEERSTLRLERARLVMTESADEAIQLLSEILLETPAHTEAAELLAGMLEGAGRIDELVDLLGRQLDTTKDAENTEAVVSLSMRLGTLNEQRGELEQATNAYQGALDWDEDNRDALRALLRLQPEDSLELGDTLERLIRLEQGDEAIVLALRLVELRRSQGDDAGVEQALEAAFEANPGHAGIRRQLVERYTASEAWHKLADLHVRDADSRASDAERVGDLRKAAEMVRDRGGDAARAAEILQRALDIDPSNRDVLLPLVDAYSTTGEHPKAVQAITAALAYTPEDAVLYKSRAALYEAMQEDSNALADLEIAYNKSGGSYAAELAEQLERAVDRYVTDGDNAGEREHRMRLSKVLVGGGDRDRAREHLYAIIDKDDHDREALSALIELERAQQQWAALGDAYRHLLQIEQGDAIAATAQQMAEAYERAEDPAGAREPLEFALASAPPEVQPSIRQLLRSVYTACGDHGALAALILEDAAVADGEARIALILEAGKLLVSADPLKATTVLEEAREAYPDEQELVLWLADAYAAVGRIDDARALLTDALGAQRGRRSKPLALVYQRLARIEDAAGNRAEAFSALVKAVENDPHNGALAMDLAEFAIALEEYEIATKALRAVTLMKASTPGSTDGTPSALRATAFHRLGQMALSAGDRRKARLMFEKALSEDPELEEARMLLEEVRNG